MAALAARRRRQQRQRAPGRRLALPPVRAAWAEAALRLGADEAAAGLLDTGLRHLGEALARDGRTPPTVFAAHIGDDSLDLWIAPPGYGAPDPWFAVGDGQVWRLPLAAAADLPARGAPAPYPALVTIGTDATGRVLVDMAAAPGLISVAGPGEPVGDALTAMATELATSRWSDGIGLTLVGFGADLAVLAPERVRMAATLAAALPGLEAWAAEAGEAIGPLNDSIPADRPAGVRAESWEPQYLITAVPPASAAERDRLLALARTCHAAGGGCLSAGEIPGAAWSWHITPDGRLHTGQLGLHVTAQVIPHEQQLAMTELFETADDLAGAALGAPVLDPALSRAATDPGTAQVEIRLLGPVAVRGATGPEPGSPGLATEIVVYLATHPGGVHPDLLTTMIWPRGVSPERREAVLGQVSAWLGTDEIGRPHLASDASGRLRLGSGVRVDWQAFGTLLALAGHAAQPHPDGRERLEETLLAEALSLVEGPFLGGPERDGYAWLAVDGLEHEVAARVADAAHRLCELQLAAGEPDGAMEAVQAGLRLAPEDELLWRDLIIAAHATGDDGLLRSVVAEICGWARVDDRVPGLAPETGALIDELLPGWRWPAG